MNKDNIQKEVLTIISETFGIEHDQLSPDLSADDVPMWDSLGHMRLIIKLEQHYSIEIDDAASIILWSAPAICQFLEETLPDNKN